MKVSRILTVSLFLLMAGFSQMAFGQQSVPNGTSYTQEKAKTYLQDHWDDKSKLKYFSLNKPAQTNMATIFKNAPDADHVRFSLGKINDIPYLFSIGVTPQGRLVGNYYVSQMPVGQVNGPCPNNCDSN